MDLMTRRRAIMGMPSGKDYTVTGNVVSVSNALAKNAKSAIVTFLPKQSGSGDPSPNNVRPISGYNDIGAVRYGKNLIDPTYRANLNQNIRLYYNSTGFMLKANTVYTFSVSSPSAQNTIREIGGSDLAVNYGKSSITCTPTRDMYVWIDVYYAGNYPVPSGGTATVNCQLEVGNTATLYEPYISPVTANVHVGGAGKNKLNPATTSLTNSTVFGLSATWSTDGVLHFSGTWTGSKANSVRILDVDPAVRSLSVKGFSTGHVSLRWQNGEDRIVADFTSMTNGSTYDITVWPMVYAGTAPSVYEPYSLFGGTVDLVSGECVVDMMLTTVSQLSWTKYSVTQGNLFRAGITNINASLNVPPSMSDQYKFVALASRADKTLSRATSSAVDIIDNDYSDAASFKSAKGSVQICYPLATPITYHLTPSQLAMLKGNNTVYSNEGSISLTYVGK